MKNKLLAKIIATVMATTMIGNGVKITVAHHSSSNTLSANAAETNISEEGWRVGHNYTGNAKFYTDDTEFFDSSKLSFVIDNNDYNDAYIEQTFKVEPNSKYKFSAMVKCYGFSADPKIGLLETGASIGYIDDNKNSHHSYCVSSDEWTRVEYIFTTGEETSKTLFLRNGRNWRVCKGTAYFSDISLAKAETEEIKTWDILAVVFTNVNAKIKLESAGNIETSYTGKYNENDINKLDIMLKELKGKVKNDIYDDCMSINYTIQPCDVTITDLIVDEKKIEKDNEKYEYKLNLGINPDSQEVRTAIEPYLRGKEYDQIMFFAPLYNDPNDKTKNLQTPVGGGWYRDGINYCKFPVSFPQNIDDPEERRKMEYGFLHELLHGIESRSKSIDPEKTISLDIDTYRYIDEYNKTGKYNDEYKYVASDTNSLLVETTNPAEYYKKKTYEKWYKAYMHQNVTHVYDPKTKKREDKLGINPDAYKVSKTKSVENISTDMTVSDSKIKPLKATMYGDVNCDGKVNKNDVDYLKKYLGNKTEYISAKSKINADVYWPGSGLNDTDAAYIEKEIKSKGILPVQVLGDVNFDDDVDMEDTASIMSHINGNKLMNATAQRAGNVNFDDKIDIEDFSIIQRHVIGEETIDDYISHNVTTTTKSTTTTTTRKSTTTSMTSTTQTTTVSNPITTSSTQTTPVKNTFGDVNNDGDINAVDASSVLAYYARISTNQEGGYAGEQELAADVNHDGDINAVDASNILAYYAYTATTKEEIKSLEEFMKKK